MATTPSYIIAAAHKSRATARAPYTVAYSTTKAKDLVRTKNANLNHLITVSTYM